MKGHPSTFSTKLVRDLAWVIASPPIQSGHIANTYWWDDKKCQKEYIDCLPTLIALDKDPSPLQQHLSLSKSKRLGHRFEAFISFWLNISPNYELIQQNIQIFENGMTLGEIDFIIREITSGKNIHLEVCVKFYLGTEPYQDTYRWFGTNTSDQLGKKLDHLLTHQSQLSQKYEEHFTHRIDQRHCLIKGRLFYPQGENVTANGITKNHLRGLWKHATVAKKADAEYIAIDKSLWLSELNHNDIIELQKNPVEIFKDRAQCYIEINRTAKTTYQEKRRVFILPDDFTFPSGKKIPL